MTLVLIAAVAENGVIGRGNTLPWHLPADLRRFKALTLGHTIIMGRRTWESIGRPLPGRRSIVVSSQAGFAPSGVTVVPSFPAALDLVREEPLAFVIGGARIFAAALPYADRLELTRVHAAIPGDVYFPPVDFSEWSLVQEEKHPADDRHALPFSFQVWERRAGPHRRETPRG